MAARRQIILGTRGSDLARAQAGMVEAGLRTAWPEHEIAVRIITTRGDEKSGGTEIVVEDRHAGRKGLFTGEIERALADRQIDVAIHSAKDLPSEATPALEIVAALKRGTVEDVLITKRSDSLDAVPRGATIATGSVRRQHQLRWVRPDLQLSDLRGNVPTRLRKLATNPWEGIILARAGLERLGFDLGQGELQFEGKTYRAVTLPQKDFLPAGGQGIIALQVRAADEATRALVAPLNQAETLLCLRAERELLRLLQGDCGTPVGVLANVEAGLMTLRAQLFDERSAEPQAATVRQTQADQTPESLAAELWELMNG